jgi:homocysteine S-methyltransferase
METTLIFHRGLDLPHFAAFHLLRDEHGLEELRLYYEPYVALAREAGVGVVLDTPTWRASSDWGERATRSSTRAIPLSSPKRTSRCATVCAQ